MRDIRVASVQFEHAPGDKKANMTKINNFVKQAAAEKVQLLVFPECCITGYCFMRHLSREELVKLAEPEFEGPIVSGVAFAVERAQYDDWGWPHRDYARRHAA